MLKTMKKFTTFVKWYMKIQCNKKVKNSVYKATIKSRRE